MYSSASHIIAVCTSSHQYDVKSALHDVLKSRGKSLILVLGDISYHDPDPSREMLHGLHRRHIFDIFQYDHSHYIEVLRLLLSLSEKNKLDPNLWIDLLNSLTNSPGKFSLEYQDREERLAAINLQETMEATSLLTAHFNQERLQFGLYGLYPKYRSYVEGLAAYFSPLGLQLVSGQVRHFKGALDINEINAIWSTLEGLYGPWLFPLSPSARASTANWIR